MVVRTCMISVQRIQVASKALNFPFSPTDLQYLQPAESERAVGRISMDLAG